MTRALAVASLVALVGCAHAPPPPPTTPPSATAAPSDAAPAPPDAPSPTGASDGAQRRPKNVPAFVWNRELVDAPMPHLPDAVKVQLAGSQAVFMAKVCAATDGHINQAAVMQGIAGADAAIIETLRRWQLRPQPLPICTLMRLVYTVDAAPPSKK